MHKAIAVCAAVILLAGCATPSNDYIVDERTIHEPQQASEAIKASANASIAAHAYAGEQRPTVVHAVAPKMPREAIEKGVEGSVRIVLLVDHKGYVSEVQILKSPSGLLSEAVVKAMKQWRFAPRIVNGSPQPFRVEQTYEFRAGG